tara:strand:- start:177 stop:380 length:204 start_codon:yes stop_codon:yes gene_type:complete
MLDSKDEELKAIALLSLSVDLSSSSSATSIKMSHNIAAQPVKNKRDTVDASYRRMANKCVVKGSIKG